MNDDLTALSLDDLRALADVCKSEAERCYAEAREWNKWAGEHRERLTRIVEEIMMRNGQLEREPVDT